MVLYASLPTNAGNPPLDPKHNDLEQKREISPEQAKQQQEEEMLLEE